MEVEPVAHRFPSIPRQQNGVTAELADARARLRQAAPPDRWDDVLAEVRRLQATEGLSPLDALKAVYARLASGWIPGG
ncbi:hypothetical protein [Blastococcus sp. CCUG 61487]|uniref:hypothetical protein n=1 Tax=Blastococcus sp. CCUG 61487 TaxID=1840703 RepID=UPI0010BFB9BD|nr:hypothetical protein [Blastococcus sp. CCUG 61487]TKJ27857.1 hypothetical protein A6V29_03195 [Blastococcus sp. CCUG 61487]